MVLKCTVKCRQYQQRLQPRAFGRAFKFHGPIFYNTLYILGDSIKQTKEHLAQTVAEFLQDISQWYYQQMKEDALIIIIFPVARVVVHSEFTLDLHPW